MFGSSYPEYCSRHAAEGMVDIVSKQCAHGACFKRPNYGLAGRTKAEYCAEHAADGMMDVV